MPYAKETGRLRGEQNIGFFLAALSSSRSLVVGWSVGSSVGPSVGPSVRPLEEICEIVTFRVLNE